jgi:D-methionine transport system permease protein
MVVTATVLATLAGLPLGILLTATGPRHILEQPLLHRVLGGVVNIGRSIPFIILMVAIIPFTRAVVGTSIGTSAAIVPLTVAAIPFVARLIDGAFKEIDPGVIEAAESMGASPPVIIFKVMIPEALPALILAVTLTAVNLVGYSAMAGAIGGGGLGDLAIRYGYQRFRGDIMLQTVAAVPFVARLVDGALREVDPGVIEAAISMGASPPQIIYKVLIPEALPALVLAVTLTAVNLVGYSAMAGSIGGGGLGDLAIRYGYQRFRGDIMLLTVIILVVLVQGIQMLGDRIANKLYHRQ